MVTIRTSTLDLTGPYHSSYREYYKCPVCHKYYPITSMSFFCAGCFRPIVDVAELSKNKDYLLLYHFCTIPESGKDKRE